MSCELDQAIFTDFSAENDDSQPIEIESFCVNCHKNGLTRILCTKIPFYHQVIVLSFNCDNCGYSNNELQNGEPVQEYGKEIVLRVNGVIDMNRQVVRSEYAEVCIPELDLTIPSKSQTGEITTVEGILRRVIVGLNQDQERRFSTDSGIAMKIDEFICRVENLLESKSTFTLKIRDVSGNSYVQNPVPFHADPNCIITNFSRTLDDRKLLSLADDQETEEQECASDPESYDVKNEVLRFPSACPNCGEPVETCMKPTDIPFFDTVIIICTTCDACGWKSNEVKSGSAIKDYGCKLTLTVKESVDLERDVLKSDSCNMSLPQLELEVGPGALGGRFTTVEGLLSATKDQLDEQSRFFFGDSMTSIECEKMRELLSHIDQVISGKRSTQVVLDDPSGNSYIQSLTAPFEDERLVKDFYQRNVEQNEELGLNGMVTENYEELKPINESDET